MCRPPRVTARVAAIIFLVTAPATGHERWSISAIVGALPAVAERSEMVDIGGAVIDRYESTNAEFVAFVAATGYRTDAERSGVGWHWEGVWRTVPGADWRHPHGPGSSIVGLERHPVVQVSWNDARAYCAWRGKRLPRGLEWERAAGAADGRRYPWGSAAPRDGGVYRASYGSDECCRADAHDGYLYTAPVGSFPLGRSPTGVEDLAGNVWEWTDEARGDHEVLRGGGWGNNPWGLGIALKHTNPPDIGLSMVGIRCAD